MRRKARRLTASILSSSSEFWLRFHMTAADGIRRKTNVIYNRISWQRPKQAEDFLRASLSCYRRGDIENALSMLETGLKEYPGSAHLLENYLRICCEKEQFARVMDFIQPTNKPLHQTLVGLYIRGDCQKHALVWLTEKVVEKNFYDVAMLWRLADLLELSGEKRTANQIYQTLSDRQANTPEDYLYAGLSGLRLGNVEDCFKNFELGLVAYPEIESIKSAYSQCCYILFDFDRYMQLKSAHDNPEVGKPTAALNFYRNACKNIPPEAFILKFKEIEIKCSTEECRLLKEEFLAHLRECRPTIENAKLSVFFSKYLDMDIEFSTEIFLIFYSVHWGSRDKAEKYLLALLFKLTLPIAPHHTAELEELVSSFTIQAQSLAQNGIDLGEPISDLGKFWYPWQSLFCLVQPRLYHRAMAAFEMLAFRLWPRLDYIAPHISHPPSSLAIRNRKIRIGFTVLDSMPMMSGFMGLLDKDLFETVYLRPGPSGESRTASDWVARAVTTVEYSDNDAYSAINTIANQELDILISGPSAPQIFFPLMARLAHLHMVLLEPNWTDGIKNSDYYISWQMAEPENYKDFYKTPVSLLQNPPYWIERSSLGEVSAISAETANDIRQRLLGLGSKERVYVCANTAPKIHLAMDEILYKLLERDTQGYLVLLRGEHAISQTLKARLHEKLGRYYERVIFLNTLKKDDAHSLLLVADCCLDSYPVGGMSSSFDGLMLGAPIVTLPADIPFGRWTAAIYEYIGVSDLTAGDSDEYIAIAMRLAMDKAWRLTKSAEIREKSSLYIESKPSFDEFQHFLVQAWRRKQSGLPPASWVSEEWQ